MKKSIFILVICHLFFIYYEVRNLIFYLYWGYGGVVIFIFIGIYFKNNYLYFYYVWRDNISFFIMKNINCRGGFKYKYISFIIYGKYLFFSKWFYKKFFDYYGERF